jgi:hypothetical protein
VSPMRVEVDPPFPVRSHGEPLCGIPSHGPIQGQWPDASGTHDDGA